MKIKVIDNGTLLKTIDLDPDEGVGKILKLSLQSEGDRAAVTYNLPAGEYKPLPLWRRTPVHPRIAAAVKPAPLPGGKPYSVYVIESDDGDSAVTSVDSLSDAATLIKHLMSDNGWVELEAEVIDSQGKVVLTYARGAEVYAER